MVEEEKRGAPRHRTLKSGRLYLNNDQRSIDCVVRDISATGARVRADKVLDFPSQIKLQIIHNVEFFDELRPCDVVWRDGDLIGLSYRQPKTVEAYP